MLPELRAGWRQYLEARREARDDPGRRRAACGGVVGCCWWALVPLLLAVGFAGKVAVMLFFDDAGRASYGRGDFDGARGAFSTNRCSTC